MFIKKIILHKFKRFSLANIDHYEYKPASNVNIFTDRNGVGKTSLLGQLNPLPADIKKDFKDDGYKYIEITHDGHEYILTSKGTKHSILRDGQELNPGGTRRVQLELIESIFNINPNTLNIVNGNMLFTIMSPSERKKYLTEISTVDYSYAISVFQKLQERRRDLTAWIKLYNEKIISITNYLNSIKDYEDIVKMDLAIKNLIEKLLKEYVPLKASPTLNDLLEKLIHKNNEFESYKYLLDLNIPEIIKLRDMTQEQLTIKEHDLKQLLDKLATLQKDGDKELLETLNGRLKSIEDQLSKKPEIWNLDNLASIYNHFQDRLMVIRDFSLEFSNISLPENFNFEQIEKTIIDKQIFIGRIKEGLSKQNHIFSEYSGMKNITLPACKSCGVPYDIQSLVVTTENNIKKLQNRLEQEIKELKHLEYLKSLYLKRANIESYIQTIFRTDEFVKESYRILNRDIPKEVNSLMFTSLLEVLNMVSCNIRDIYLPLLKEKEDLIKQITPLLEMSLLSKEEKNNTLVLFYKLIDETTITINNMKKDIDKFNKTLKEFDLLGNIRIDIKSILEKINEAKKIERTKLENNYIETTINKLKEKNIENNKILEQYRSNQKELETLISDRTKAEREAYLVSKLLDILSPSSGLIAKSINSFLGVFINDMNIIINSVWSYKIKILPCDLLEGDDLDYRFKVEVNDSFIVEDVSKLSSSMREIVDLAFRLVYIKYKNLDKVPIILDEFGRTMDKEHRINAFNMVDQVIANNFDQIFLVSHFEEMYGRFKNADFPEIK